MIVNKMPDKSENSWGLFKIELYNNEYKEVIKSSLGHQNHRETRGQTYQPIGKDPSIQAWWNHRAYYNSRSM